MNIEETICESFLPVNTIAFLNRAIEILNQAGTNCASSLEEIPRINFRKVLWFINMQMYGPMTVVDLYDEWTSLCSLEGKPPKLVEVDWAI